MSNDVTGAREDLAALIRAALGPTGPTVDAYVPEELDERHVVIQLPANALAGEVTLAGPPASYDLTLEAYLLLSGLGNREVHDAVDDFLARALPALHASPVWRVVPGSLSSILSFQTAQGTAAGVSVAATATLTITQE